MFPAGFLAVNTYSFDVKRKRYLWVCQNGRPPGHPKGCCLEKGADGLLDRLKAGLFERKLHREVRVMGSGCMDLCWVGPSVAVMPDMIFYGGVAPGDVPEILDALERGTVVDRLVVPPEEFIAPDKRGSRRQAVKPSRSD